MMLIVEILLIVNRYKMENLKTKWKLPEKAKNPRSQQEIGCEEIENILKTAGFILFFLKKLPPPLPNSRNRQKSGHQGGQTAPKWLDNTVKPCPKISWRNRQFSTIQQRKKPVTSFLSQAYGAGSQTWTGDLLITNQLLYQLSHTSTQGQQDYYTDFLA